jgi:hypothetical protein
MHWTLLVLITLSAACLIGNAVQLVIAGSVRLIGLLICGGWVVQQLYWARTGTDSILLFIVCDCIIIAWYLEEHWLRRRTFDTRERLIALTIPPTTALVIYAQVRGAPTTTSWWINWWLVAAQMVLGMPTPARQPASGSVSHGTLRRAPREGV